MQKVLVQVALFRLPSICSNYSQKEPPMDIMRSRVNNFSENIFFNFFQNFYKNLLVFLALFRLPSIWDHQLALVGS